MKHRTCFAIVTLIFLSTSCGEHHWPPYRTQLASMFHENLETMSAIEREMIEDGLPLIGTGLNRAFTHPDVPELTESQKAKYAKLFGELDFYANFQRFGSETRVDLTSREVRSRTYLFFFSHGAIPSWLPNCDAMDQIGSCGACFVPVKAAWYLEYRWYNDSQAFSPEDCIDRRE